MRIRWCGSGFCFFIWCGSGSDFSPWCGSRSWLQKKAKTNLSKSAKICSYSVNLGSTSANWCGCGSGFLFEADADPDVDPGYQNDALRIRMHNTGSGSLTLVAEPTCVRDETSADGVADQGGEIWRHHLHLALQISAQFLHNRHKLKTFHTIMCNVWSHVQYLYGTALYFHKETRIGSESKYSIIQDNNRWKGL